MHATVKLAAEGSAALAKGETGTREIDVPKRREATQRLWFRGRRLTRDGGRGEQPLGIRALCLAYGLDAL